MAKEFTITAAFVSDQVSHRAGKKLLECFSGYTRHDHLFGGYTFTNGEKTEESAVSWVIATDGSEFMIRSLVSLFAEMYCLIGEQESIYFKDTGGNCFFVYEDRSHKEAK